MTRNRLIRKYRSSDDEVDINLTPMLDVVFILLIFFIITTSFVQDGGIKVALSEATTATPQEASIWVSIDRHGEVWIKDSPVDIRALSDVLRRMYLENSQGTVVVLADEASNNAVLVKVLDQIRRAGIDNIAIAAELSE